MEIRQIDRQKISDFRAQYLDKRLVWDLWDERSAQYAAYRGEVLVSALRISPENNSRLPFHDVIGSDVSVRSGSVEVGRAVTATNQKQNNFVVWFRWLRQRFEEDSSVSDIYVDSVLTPSRHNLLVRLGFSPIGVGYFDARYSAQSSIYSASIDVFRKHAL